MKRQFFVWFVLAIGCQSVFGQLITSEPEYPTQNDSIIIYFDATKGDGGLAGYTGTDVYAHTGVITDKSTGSSDWKHVIANWNVNISKAKLTKVGTDLWKLSIGYIKDYYGVPDGERVLRLAFVFRNGNGSVTGRDVGGADIFYDLFEPGLTALFEQPVIDNLYGDPRRTPLFLSPDDSLTIVGKAAALGTLVDSIRFRYEGNDIAVAADSVLTYLLMGNALRAGINEFSLIASDTAGVRDTSYLTIVQNPPIQDIALPAGIKPGINITGDNSVVLALFAPYKDFVYVIGDFNDWYVDIDYFMNRDYVSEDSVVYWLEIDNLSPTSEYAFQYLVDGKLRIADPYTNKILDPWNDKEISNTTYPNLKPYPDGKTEQAVSVFQTMTDEYNWSDTDYVKPPKQKLVIYELLLRDFLAAHDFKTLADTLDYLEKLGINAIELMPVNEFEGNSSWGYNPSFYFALDKYYGPAIDFKRFVDECHRRGIAVIIDMVLNHSYGQSPLVRLYWNDTLSRPAANNLWYNESSPNTTYSWGYDFNHESIHTQAFVDRVNRFWIEEFHVDGYRFDFTKGFTNKPGDGGAFDETRITILKRMADEIWKLDPTNYVILEHFADNSEERILADYGMMLWANSNYNYAQVSMGYTSDSDFSWGYYKTRGWTNPNLVTYMESHDEERLMYKNLTWGNSHGSYNIKELHTALARQKMVNALFLTQPGPKMIWQFGELGYDMSIDDPCRLCEKDPVWGYYKDIYRRNLYETIQALIKLRNENDVFTNSNTNVQMSVSGAVKQINLSGEMQVLVIANMDVDSVDAVHNFPYGGTWYDYFSGDSIYIQLTSTPISMAPGEFHIYTSEKLETPVIDPILGLDNDFSLPQKFRLHQNFPNPFNPITTLRYDLEKPSDVQISIVDLRGHRVWQKNYSGQTAGRYSLIWNGRDLEGRQLQSGIYLVVLQRAKDRLVQKITLLK